MILFLCYVFPPLAVLLMGRPFSAVLNFFLTCFMWFPGIGHALVCYADYKGDKMTNKVVRAVNRPTWTQAAPAPVRQRRQRVEAVYIDDPGVGMNGTQFRRKA